MLAVGGGVEIPQPVIRGRISLCRNDLRHRAGRK
jgi:hypothetical protein